MDFLNSSLTQLKDLFLSMTPAARITAGLLVAVVVVSLGYLATHEITGPEVYLLSGEAFSNDELASMEEAFGKEKLGSYEIVAGKIRVPHSHRSDYMDALARHEAMPEAFGDIITKALEAGSVLTSPSDRQAYLKNAREVQLGQTVSMIKEIEAATVMYDTETKPTGLLREKVYSASVIVEPVGLRPLDPKLASSIRRLVCGAIAGLEPKDVAVTDRNTGHTTFGNSQDMTSPHDDPYFARKLCYEQEYTDDILSALRQIRGLTVTTHVELDTEQITEEEIRRDAPPAAAASEKTSAPPTIASDPLAGLLGFKSQGNAPRSLASMASASGAASDRRGGGTHLHGGQKDRKGRVHAQTRQRGRDGSHQLLRKRLAAERASRRQRAATAPGERPGAHPNQDVRRDQESRRRDHRPTRRRDGPHRAGHRGRVPRRHPTRDPQAGPRPPRPRLAGRQLAHDGADRLGRLQPGHAAFDDSRSSDVGNP